jgi:hypothetical protein
MELVAHSTQQYTPLKPIDKCRIKAGEKLYAFELELRLKQWGWWLAKQLDGGLGYNPRSITCIALEGSRSTGGHYPADDSRAEQIHEAVNVLTERHKHWAQVLKAEYVRGKLDLLVEQGKALKQKQQERAQRLDLSYSNYRVFLRSAKSFIEGRITS